MKKKMLMASSLVAVSALSILGTKAYLQDTDQDVNVMTTKNVYIDQLEYERVFGESGFEGKFKDYQPKSIYPAVYQDNTMDWAGEKVSFGSIGAPGEVKVFHEKMKNVQDKFVFVKNTGTTDAYFRTIIAIEEPQNLSGDLIHINMNENENVQWSQGFETEIDGVRYWVFEVTYQEALKPNTISEPSLLQVYLDPKATNEDMIKFGETFDILVFSQAVQAEGFNSATEALVQAFGEVNQYNHPWTNVNATSVKTVNELKTALAAGEDITLSADIVTNGESIIVGGNGEATLNLNGHTLKNSVSGKAAIINYGDLTITGGTIVNENTEMQGASAIRNYGTLELNNMTVGSDKNRGSAVENIGGDVTINGGVFETFDRSLMNGAFAYVFSSNGGTMKINDATVSGKVQGVFAATNGAVIDVDGGSYTMEPNGSIHYMVHCTNNARVNLISGTYKWHDRASLKDGAVVGDEYVTISENCTLINWR